MSQQTDHDSTPTEGRNGYESTALALDEIVKALRDKVEHLDSIAESLHIAADPECTALLAAAAKMVAPTPPPTAAPEPPPQLPYAADWEPLWTVCSNLESILLSNPRGKFPEAFHANLKRAFALLRERYALPPSPNAQPEGLIGENHRQAAAPAPTAAPEPPPDIREQIGRIMHESWSKTKRAQGFHGPDEDCHVRNELGCNQFKYRCSKFHRDLIPWERLPESQRDINRHALDAILESGILVAPTSRPHRIGVYDYQSLCDCLRHNMEQAIPGYVYRDPQDAIQTLAARVMTLERKATADGCSCPNPALHLELAKVSGSDKINPANCAPTAEGPREGLGEQIEKLIHGEFTQYSRTPDGFPFPTNYGEIRKLMRQAITAALERAAQIAEEYRWLRGNVGERIAAEIRKLAKDL